MKIMNDFLSYELNTFARTEEHGSSCRQVLGALTTQSSGHPDTPTGTWAMTHTSHAELHSWVSTT